MNKTATEPIDPDMPAQQLRLHMGELTANEMRVARAAIRWANTANAPSAVAPEAALTPVSPQMIDNAYQDWIKRNKYPHTRARALAFVYGYRLGTASVPTPAHRPSSAQMPTPMQQEAKCHAVELEQCSIFAADVGKNIASAMTDAAQFLRQISGQPGAAGQKPAAQDTEVTYAARFNRLASICRRIKWIDVGKPALNDEPTRSAMADLAEWLLADGVDATMSEEDTGAANAELDVAPRSTNPIDVILGHEIIINGPVLKKLEWDRTSNWKAQTSIGCYGIRRFPDGFGMYAPGTSYLHTPDQLLPTLDLAKDAAQIDHDARVTERLDDAEQITALINAARAIVERKSSSYKGEGGRQIGIEADDGEMVWLVHSDEMTALELALPFQPERVIGARSDD